MERDMKPQLAPCVWAYEAHGQPQQLTNLAQSCQKPEDFYMFQFLVSYGSKLVVAYLVGKLLLEGLKGCKLT